MSERYADGGQENMQYAVLLSGWFSSLTVK